MQFSCENCMDFFMLSSFPMVFLIQIFILLVGCKWLFCVETVCIFLAVYLAFSE